MGLMDNIMKDEDRPRIVREFVLYLEIDPRYEEDMVEEAMGEMETWLGDHPYILDYNFYDRDEEIEFELYPDEEEEDENNPETDGGK